jgi:RNA polymerase sigma-70 factor, ECF subfamily
MKHSNDKSIKFDSLVLEHHVRLRAFVRSLGVDADWVDDLSQEAFMTAYEEWETFDSKRDFGKWVRGIAANIVRNEIRKQARRRRILHSDLTHLLLNHHGQLEERSLPMTVVAIRACLAKLNSENRNIIQGRYVDGFSILELADRFGKSAANMRQILLRIRRQIRSCVESHITMEDYHG